jgi:hypothetical protein
MHAEPSRRIGATRGRSRRFHRRGRGRCQLGDAPARKVLRPSIVIADRRQIQECLVVGDCPPALALGFEFQGARDIRRGDVRPDLDSPGEVADGPVVLAAATAGKTAEIVGEVIVRIDGDCLIEVGVGASAVTLRLEDARPRRVGVAIFRIDLDCLAKVRDGTIVVAFRLEGMGSRRIRI